MEVEVCESEGVCDVLCNVPPDDPEQEESMETHEPSEEAAAAPSSQTNAAPPKPQYSYRVPSTVCFGHGSVRGFRGRQTRRK
ncbi:zinc finger protein 511-like [Nematolebias whitei]|uniref:zinc finger protein 511-like n=1 Tax=Nematolebias whitei TaxID=451745 RepID=UPI00189AF034|nr:zinc finger protein 511-like [Nematolebias whitei]